MDNSVFYIQAIGESETHSFNMAQLKNIIFSPALYQQTLEAVKCNRNALQLKKNGSYLGANKYVGRTW